MGEFERTSFLLRVTLSILNKSADHLSQEEWDVLVNSTYFKLFCIVIDIIDVIFWNVNEVFRSYILTKQAI